MPVAESGTARSISGFAGSCALPLGRPWSFGKGLITCPASANKPVCHAGQFVWSNFLRSRDAAARQLFKPGCLRIPCLDDSLLRSWLDLPPGSWPPDHYTLLGLERGECDPAEVEAIVLSRMDRLRMHQLLHPELVTEGMNRLAQSLICLTDAVTRAAYDAQLAPKNLTPQPPSLRGKREQDKDPPAFEEELEGGASHSTPYELLPEEEVEPLERMPVPELVSPPVVELPPRSRRELFTQLAMLRRLLIAWQKLRPVLADPEESLTRPARVLALLEAIAELQPLHDDFIRVAEGHGGTGDLVMALIRKRFVLPTFRSLVPEERRALSIDWRRTELLLSGEYAKLREVVRAGRPQRRNQRMGKLVLWVAHTPEVLLLVLTIAAIAVALLRARGVS